MEATAAPAVALRHGPLQPADQSRRRAECNVPVARVDKTGTCLFWNNISRVLMASSVSRQACDRRRNASTCERARLTKEAGGGTPVGPNRCTGPSLRPARAEGRNMVVQVQGEVHLNRMGETDSKRAPRAAAVLAQTSLGWPRARWRMNFCVSHARPPQNKCTHHTTNKLKVQVDADTFGLWSGQAPAR